MHVGPGIGERERRRPTRATGTDNDRVLAVDRDIVVCERARHAGRIGVVPLRLAIGREGDRVDRADTSGQGVGLNELEYVLSCLNGIVTLSPAIPRAAAPSIAASISSAAGSKVT